MRRVLLELQLPRPLALHPCTMTYTMHRKAPGPRPHSWCMVELAWPMKPWRALKALTRELADTGVGLAHPVPLPLHWQSSQPFL